jgi:hypothetical protein
MPIVWALALCVFAHSPLLEAAPRTAVKGNDCRPRYRYYFHSRSKPKPRTQAKPPIVSKGKAAVFSFEGDDVEPVRESVVRLLRTKGLQVNTTLRPVDTPEQYRDMSVALGLGVYVHGQMKPQGRNQAVAIIVIRSGLTGKPIAITRFVGDRRTLPGEVAEGLWYRVNRVVTRACNGAARPGRYHNVPTHIEAGTPIEGAPLSWEKS